MMAAPKKVCVIGSGNWGSAIAKIVGANAAKYDKFETTVNMWVFEEMINGRKLTEIINTDHENVKYLPGHKLPPNVLAVPDLVESVKGADILIFVVPHQFIIRVCDTIKEHIKKDAVGMSLIKGVDASPEGLKLISQVIRAKLGITMTVLMGANIANEVAEEKFCETTIGCKDKTYGPLLKDLMQTTNFRVTVVEESDVVEICGALKNIVAVGAGFCDGLGFGDNTKAAVIRLGLMEMIAFAKVFCTDCPVSPATFLESCGIADLITTCYGGRNRKIGEAFAKTGKTIEQLENELLNGQKLQGPATASEVNLILKQKNMVEKGGIDIFKRNTLEHGCSLSLVLEREVWLPHNVTWADLADPAPGVEYPKAGHLLTALPLALGIFAVRILFERFIASTCARSLHIQPGVGRRAQPNAVLEKVFTSITKNPDSRHLDGLSKQLDWEVRKVQRWFRHRRNQDKPSTHTKFCESMWRFTFYSCIFTYGFQFLWQSPWMWDTRHCWYGYPYQVLTPGLYHYYVTELAFYWSLMFSQFTDIKRKDFLIMFIHHLATISLISFSYVNNMVRVGSLVMCVHDASDFLLEAAKLANYAKYQRLCDFLFIVFSVVFFITRLVIYPIWILNSTMFESWAIVGPYPSWWLFNILLLVLQVLHIIWSYLISRIAVKAMLRGKVCNDVRSDIESSSDEEPDTPSDGLKASHTPKGENGTNGHCATAVRARVQNHSSW